MGFGRLLLPSGKSWNDVWVSVNVLFPLYKLDMQHKCKQLDYQNIKKVAEFLYVRITVIYYDPR